ncbi:tripartite tricarboxylate transporter substrate binding protein [Cereibacter sphaeroides]|nr:tripartite tricarboxylate transporter substrate binding protein [Cereibacter sphaeroides]
MLKNFRLAGAFACLLTGTLPLGAGAQSFQPENPECIAPANPGGGWDFICRTTARFLFEEGLITSAMQVTNMVGGGGGVAFAHVTQERNDADNLIVAASVSTSARLAQGIFEGASADDVHWLATFGAEYGVLAVAADSPFQTLGDLMTAVLENPRGVRFAGGSSVGSYDHIKPMLVAQAAGLEDVRQLNYVAFSGGGEAVTALLSGSVEVVSGDFSEVRGFIESGDVRVIAILAPERLAQFPDIPTAVEQGIDVVGANWRGLYMPAGASDEAKEFWSNAIQTMAESPEFQAALEEAAIAPFNNFGDDMQAFITRNIEDVRNMSIQIGIIQQ